MSLAIAFPAIDPVALQIGPLAIRWYALAYLAGFLGGWRYVIYLTARAQKADKSARPGPEEADAFLTWTVLGVILGGRLGYALFYNLPYFINHPLEVLAVWQGGMSFHGGLLGVIVAIILFSRRRGFNPLKLSDPIAAAVPIGLFFGRIANFINSELWGRTTEVSWGVVFPNGGPLPRHPSQLYEAVFEGLVLFVILAILAHRPATATRMGLLTGVFLALYGLSRFLVEFVREPDPQLGFLWLGATMGQLLSLPMIAFGVWLVWRSGKAVEAPVTAKRRRSRT
ncbi:MAG: prolipoprotein diacylglyceryl transferase [Pseudomonadota bacterium]